MRKAYFAHPVSQYDSEEESLIVSEIVKLGDVEVINPNATEHTKAYLNEGMSYFVRMCDSCDLCVFSTFSDGSVSAGVAKEVQSFLDRSAEVYFADMSTNNIGLNLIENLDGFKVLSITETRGVLKALGARS